MMNHHRLLHAAAIAVLAATLTFRARAADDWIRYTAQPAGSLIKIDGTSTIHDWSVDSKMVGGYIEFDPAFSLDHPSPGKVNARVAVLIPVRQLRSDKTAMDTIMYESMKEKDHRRIDYRLTEMTLKEAPKSADAPMLFETKGELVVAGVTNVIQMPVTMTRVEKDKLKFAGSTTVKMTNFGIQPPTKLGLFSTGDDVKLTFEWLTARKDLSAK